MRRAPVSDTVDLGGPIHFVDFGGRGPRLVLLHGLGSSHATWLAVGRLLAEEARVWAVDLAGFGYSPLAGRSASIGANRRVLDRFLDRVVGGPAVLVGNSMGGVIAMMEAVEAPAMVAGLVLVNPGLRRPYGVSLDQPVAWFFGPIVTPTVGEVYLRRRWTRLGPDGVVRASLAFCCVDPERVPREVVEAMVDVATESQRMSGARHAYLEAARSLVPLVGSAARFKRLVDAVDQPTLLLHGEHDRLVPLAAADALASRRPDWTYVVLDDVGHTPQMETPDRFVGTVRDWLGNEGSAAAIAAE
jgi:pimeloyl-ACP methyl ester carboxylesterase